MLVAGKSLDPALVLAGAARENLFGDRRHPHHFSEEVNHLLGPGQPGKIAVDHDTVEAVVDERQQIAEQFDEQFHGLHYTR